MLSPPASALRLRLAVYAAIAAIASLCGVLLAAMAQQGVAFCTSRVVLPSLDDGMAMSGMSMSTVVVHHHSACPIVLYSLCAAVVIAIAAISTILASRRPGTHIARAVAHRVLTLGAPRCTVLLALASGLPTLLIAFGHSENTTPIAIVATFAILTLGAIACSAALLCAARLLLALIVDLIVAIVCDLVFVLCAEPEIRACSLGEMLRADSILLVRRRAARAPPSELLFT